jgi:hypothetical protein
MECGMHEERRITKQDKLPDPQVCKYFVIIHQIDLCQSGAKQILVCW